jgi:hypothetical protein
MENTGEMPGAAESKKKITGPGIMPRTSPSPTPHAADVRFLDVRVETLVGDQTAGHADGVGTDAKFEFPRQLCMLDEHTLLVADSGSHKIRRIDLQTSMTSIPLHWVVFEQGDGGGEFRSCYALYLLCRCCVSDCRAGHDSLRLGY